MKKLGIKIEKTLVLSTAWIILTANLYSILLPIFGDIFSRILLIIWTICIRNAIDEVFFYWDFPKECPAIPALEHITKKLFK